MDLEENLKGRLLVNRIGKILLLLHVFYLPQVYGYVCGYTRLYSPETQTTLDFVYDVHKDSKKLSHDQMHNLSCDDLLQKLYPSEKALVESLEHLNRTNPHDTTVIWEYAPNFIPAEVHLLAHPERLVTNRLRKVSFIPGDTWRSDYPGCLMSVLHGGSLEHRVDRRAIIKNYGSCVWEGYKELMETALRNLKTSYGAHREKIADSRFGDDLYFELFFGGTPYVVLADLEMIANILQSPHHHIVLYAGGLHCYEVVKFLLSTASFEMIHTVVNEDRSEINSQELKRIRRPGNSRALNPTSGTRPVQPGKSAKPSVEIAASESKKKRLFLGGAIALGALMLSVYCESQ